jgi:hypothetical protein
MVSAYQKVRAVNPNLENKTNPAYLPYRKSNFTQKLRRDTDEPFVVASKPDRLPHHWRLFCVCAWNRFHVEKQDKNRG